MVFAHAFKERSIPVQTSHAVVMFTNQLDNMKIAIPKPFLLLFIIGLFSCGNMASPDPSAKAAEMAKLPQTQPGQEVATFAGGCFWCTEGVFERLEGVDQVVSGYSGGSAGSADYKQVSTGKTGHAEAIQVYYNPLVISFEELLEIFFLVAHDPTQLNRQGADVGTQYRSAVFYHDEVQQQKTLKMIARLEGEGKVKGKIVTEVVPFRAFYPAEEYHQNYLPANPNSPYIQNVAMPKVEKLEDKYSERLKPEYKN